MQRISIARRMRGAHWTNISSNLPNAPANSVVVDPNDANTALCCAGHGSLCHHAGHDLRYCKLLERLWHRACRTRRLWNWRPRQRCLQAMAAAGEFRAATYGRGIWQIPLLTASTAAQPAISLSPNVAYLQSTAGWHGERTANRHGYKYRNCTADRQPDLDHGRLQ